MRPGIGRRNKTCTCTALCRVQVVVVVVIGQRPRALGLAASGFCTEKSCAACQTILPNPPPLCAAGKGCAHGAWQKQCGASEHHCRPPTRRHRRAALLHIPECPLWMAFLLLRDILPNNDLARWALASNSVERCTSRLQACLQAGDHPGHEVRPLH